LISGIPYWRLSSFYFFYFALVGALSPYLSLYLEDIGLTSYAIGLVNGVLMGTKIIAPNVWGWLCDKTGKRLKVITFGCIMASLFFAGLFFWQSLAVILLITFCYSFFWNAILSQFDLVTVQYLKKEPSRYSQVRVWGSIGFTVSVVFLGWLFDYISIQYLIPIAWLLLCLISASCFFLKEPPQKVAVRPQQHWVHLLKKPPVIAFFLAAMLLQFSFGAYYSFFSLHLEDIGYSRLTIGIIILISVQLIHALSFGAAHAVCIEMIRKFFTGSNAGQGLALYSALTFGVGGSLGAISSGFLWSVSGAVLFSVSAFVALLAALIVFFFLPKEQLKQLHQ